MHVFGMSFGCLLDVFWVSFGSLLGVFWTFRWLQYGGSSLPDGNLNLHFVFTICWQKNGNIRVKHFFCTFFSAHGFANSRAYKIKNKGVDGPCPSYKIKSIAFEQRKTLGLWMSFGWPFGLLDGHRKYQELGFPTGCGEKRWKCHHNTSNMEE